MNERVEEEVHVKKVKRKIDESGFHEERSEYSKHVGEKGEELESIKIRRKEK